MTIEKDTETGSYLLTDETGMTVAINAERLEIRAVAASGQMLALVTNKVITRALLAVLDEALA